MKPTILRFLALAALASAQSQQKLTGTITDSMCARANHSQMQMGPTDAECTIACVRAHGAEYVLFDGKNSYTLSDEKLSEKFAGQKVTVTGTLDAKTQRIKVDGMVAAK